MRTTKQPVDQPVTFTLELTEHEMLVMADGLFRLPGAGKTYSKLSPEVRAAVDALPRSEPSLVPIRTQAEPIPSNVLNWLRKGTL